MRPESSEVGIGEREVAHQSGRERQTGDWVKVRRRVVVNVVVAGPVVCPDSLLLARPDAEGVLLLIGLSR